MPRRLRNDKRRSNRLNIHDWRVLLIGTAADLEAHFGSLADARDAWDRHRSHPLFRTNPETRPSGFWLFDAGDPSLALFSEPIELAEHDALDARRRDWLAANALDEHEATILPIDWRNRR